MITKDEFQALINSGESSILDFKQSMYDFSNDPKLENTAGYVKDIISFTNTIRSETSYIIIGIEEKKDGSRVFHGLDKQIDDAILQDKVKDKVHPRPHFKFYTFNHLSKDYGIFEFPVTKYETPIYSTVKMRGLDVGKVYFRRGTANTEALALEVIKINTWLQVLKSADQDSSMHDKISVLIGELSTATLKLSQIFSDMLKISRQFDLKEIVLFATQQLKGIDASEVQYEDVSNKYRIQEVFFSLTKVTINHYAFIKTTPQMLKQEMDNKKDFYKMPFFFNNPLYEIEEFIEKKDGIVTFTQSVNTVLPEIKENYPVYIYVFSDDFSRIYNKIRQRAIDLLIKL